VAGAWVTHSPMKSGLEKPNTNKSGHVTQMDMQKSYLGRWRKYLNIGASQQLLWTHERFGALDFGSQSVFLLP